MANIAWPPASKRGLIGKSISRIDGPEKASGRAKYTYDQNPASLLVAKMLTSPYAHAKITALDTSAAERMPGVRAVYVFNGVGKEVNWEGHEIVAVAADTEELAEDAVRRIRVEYQQLPYFVDDADLAQAAKDGRARQLGAETSGDPSTGFQQAEVTSEGDYGIPVITHCCLESHGSVAQWQGDKLNVWISTQNVSGSAGEYAQSPELNVPASNVNVDCQVMGGGFGSKFGVDTWGLAAAALAKKAGRPVKLMLERKEELLMAGSRPSLRGKIRVGAKRDGTLVAWDSDSWGTGGMSVVGIHGLLPYIFRGIPNRGSRYTAVRTNTGPARAWRAPNHPQACFLTMAALDDLAAKLGMDPLDFFVKNLPLAGERAALYQEELQKAAELMDWKAKWHPRGDKAPGPTKRGVGLSIHTWGGLGHDSYCRTTIHPDGSVEVATGSQDLGTGTRTVINIVAAETLGLPLDGVRVEIGDNKYPPDGASGGSTTVGGVSSSTRVSATNALNELLAKVAPGLGTTPDKLEAVGGKVQVIGDPSKAISWKKACARLGTTPIVAMGQRNMSLISSGVGGAQMAEVSVDVETGVVRMEKMVAVQDCGLIIDVKTAMSQVYGACIMGTCYALHEEKIMDQQTGTCLNPNMEFYKLSGLDDVGDIVVHMMTDSAIESRGVIGLGEPPVISPGAAIANAVANAIGVRVPDLPMTPGRVLDALGKGEKA